MALGTDHCCDWTKQVQLWFQHKNAHEWEEENEAELLVEVQPTMVPKLAVEGSFL